MKEKNFSIKIEYLFKRLELGEEAFTKLFWNEKRSTLYTRKKSVIGKWLEGDIDKPKGFYFDTYPIAKLQSKDKPFFSKSSFLEDSFIEFKKRVDEYVNHITQPKVYFEYKYLYYYNSDLAIVTYDNLETIEEIERGLYRVKLNPPILYKEQEFEPYYGKLQIIKDYYHFSIENSFERVTLYFMLNKGYKTNRTIYGLSLGLSFDKGFPVSRKMLLSKYILSAKEEREFYLNANENEILLADESSDSIYSNKEENYLQNLNKKINNLATYTQKANKILDKDINKIKNLKFDSEKLKQIGYSIDTFLEKKQLESDDVLQKLIGTWHYYGYGSLADENRKFKIWDMSVEIDVYKQVKYFIDGELLFRGDINTTYNKYKSYIRLYSINSSDLIITTFYNKEVYRKIFKVSVLSKQYGIEYDMISLGFFSKDKLELNVIEETLGDTKEVLFNANGQLEQRITELYKKLEY
jgi:hypothetical protein